MTTAFLFPGQGAQRVGMGVDLCMGSTKVMDLFENAKSCVGLDMYQLCLDGPESELNQVQNALPALVTTELAVAYALMEKGVMPDAVAGYSIGEYAAHVVAGTVYEDDALTLVARIGALSAMVANRTSGDMAVLANCTLEQAEELCTACSSDGMPVVVAAYDCPGQVIISGGKEGLEKALAAWREQGGRSSRLGVDCPFHSSLMQPVASSMKYAIKSTLFGPGEVTLYNCCDAQAFQKDEWLDVLTRQLLEPVQWDKTIRAMIGSGVDTFIQCGPGQSVADAVRCVAKDMGAQVRVVTVDTAEDLGSVAL